MSICARVRCVGIGRDIREGKVGNGGEDLRPDGVSRWAIAALVVLTGFAAFKTAAGLRAPYPLDPADGGMLSSAWHAANGERIYTYLSDPPFIFNIHNPVMIYLSALAMKVAGPVAWGPRLIAVFFYIATAVVVFLLVRRLTGSARAGLVAGLFLLVGRYFFSRTALAACDYPAAFFSALGLYLWASGGSSRLIAPAAFVIGYLSKQSGIAAPAALVAGLLLTRQWREGARFAAGYVTSMAAGAVICYGLFGAAFFKDTIVYGLTGGVSPGPATREFLVLVCYLGPICAVPYLWLRGGECFARRVIPLYAAAGFVAGLASMRAGGSRAYMFDFSIALALALGCAWPHLAARAGALEGRARAALVGALTVQAALIAAGTLSVISFDYEWVKLHGHWSEGGRHAARLAVFEEGGMVLSPYTGYDLGTKGFNFTTDPHRLGQLLVAGVVKRSALTDAVASKSFSAVILPPDERGFELFDDGLKEAIRRNYVFRGEVERDEYYVRPD